MSEYTWWKHPLHWPFLAYIVALNMHITRQSIMEYLPVVVFGFAFITNGVSEWLFWNLSIPGEGRWYVTLLHATIGIALLFCCRVVYKNIQLHKRISDMISDHPFSVVPYWRIRKSSGNN